MDKKPAKSKTPPNVKAAVSDGGSESHLISIPSEIGKTLVESAAFMMCPLLSTDKFVAFCKARNISIDRDRLLRLERLGLFAPVFRVCTPNDDNARPFDIPIRDGNNWFDKGWAWDATHTPAQHQIPNDGDRSQEGYYSIFQVDWLRLELSMMTLPVPLDSYLTEDALPEKWWRKIEGSIEYSRALLDSARTHQYRRAIALLCQLISNRYYPRATGNLRSIRVSSISSWDSWLSVRDHRWDWREEARKWDPRRVESLFDLTPERLEHAYDTLAGGQSWFDPLANWYPLVQFVPIDERRRLKGDALLAETLREGALMLRNLYADLYNKELPPPNEVHGTVITHVPELEVRKDVRRHLEFVVNRYGLNPRPKLVLFLEGESEERMVSRLFDDYFGFPASRAWIEIINVRGVDTATGGRRDRYTAILRLVDYLHHHQTLTFIVLDNENNAKQLRKNASSFRSIFGYRRRATRPEYVRVWKQSFEFDNFSDTELAAALSETAEKKVHFTTADLASCRRSDKPGSALSRLYQEHAQRDLDKLRLSDILATRMLSPNSRKAIRNRPIIKVLERVVKLAMKNPFPVMQEIWETNQRSKVLAKKR